MIHVISSILMINIIIVSSSDFGHIVEIYNFSPDLKTQDLMQALSMFRYVCFVFIIQNCSYSVVNETYFQKRRQSVPLFPCLNCLDNDMGFGSQTSWAKETTGAIPSKKWRAKRKFCSLFLGFSWMNVITNWPEITISE